MVVAALGNLMADQIPFGDLAAGQIPFLAPLALGAVVVWRGGVAGVVVRGRGVEGRLVSESVDDDDDEDDSDGVAVLSLCGGRGWVADGMSESPLGVSGGGSSTCM